MWSDSYGEDIADTNSDESSEFDSEDGYEDEDDFIDDSDLDMYNPSHVPNSGGRLTFWKTANFLTSFFFFLLLIWSTSCVV